MKSQALDETGNRYGLLTVLYRGPNWRTSAQWYCRCDCGQTLLVRGGHLRNGHTTGCRHCRATKHGHG